MEAAGGYRIPSCRVNSRVNIGLISVSTLGNAQAGCPQPRREARCRVGRRVGCDRPPMKVRNCGNFELVTVCRSSDPVAFLRSEPDQYCDLSATTARDIAITRVKASPTGTYAIPMTAPK